jgi:WD40 repeat protein/class 3 adenylate cyclase/energy-coupling factor transporter ATP-binding protein EcfA2
MPDLPAGRVTFLFTDIEGSTRLLHALGDRYAQVLADHRGLLRAAFARHAGVEVDTQGDSFFVAFSDAGEALAAAEESQRALAGHTWPENSAVKVRMGLHTGEPLVADGHYVGIDVHRAARIGAAAHGGQVIVSERTTRLLGGDASLTPALRDLGAHHLKDLPEPERLFQLLADGLLRSFPPPRVHEEAIEAAGLPDYSVPPADVPCPYKGLLPFEPEDSEFFFGREHLAEDVAARVEATGFLAVVGPSGSGKSSLVRAGVVPALQRSADGELRTAIFAPGTHPLAQLDDAREAPLLVVDQFEEVFTLCRDEEERAAFIDALLDRAANGAWVVVALRADFYGHCATYPRLAGALEERQALVGPMTEEELRRAIERPGEQAGLVLEPGMVEAILRDVAGQPGALPLLSHSLLETWRRRSGRMLTVIGYLQSGGVQGAIAKTAETVYRDMFSAEQQGLARNVFLRLTELGEGTEDTRRRASTSELIPRPEQEGEVSHVLRTLADARLVTIGEGTVEVAHEALIRHWPTLREWLDEDREGRLLHRRLTEAAQEWEALGRDPGALFRGMRLATTGDWATAHDPELNQLEREFLTASRQASAGEAERQRRANRRLRVLLVGAVVLLALALVAGVVALVQRSRARDAQSRAEAQALRSDAERLGTLALAEPKLDRSLLLAMAGFKLEDLPETRGDLLAVLQKSPALIGVAHVSRTDLPAIAASEHDGLLASGDSAGVVHFTDTRTWRPSGTAVHLDGPVSQDAMEFSPDGSTLAVATTKGDERVNLYLVDVATRKSRLVWSGSSVPAVLGPRRFMRMAFSPDGTRLAVAVATAPTPSPTPLRQRLLLLAVPTGFVDWERRYPLHPGQNEVAVAFTPQGTLVSSAQQGETLVWDPKSGRIMRRFGIGGPFGVSPNGTRLAVAQNNANPAVQKASLAVLDLRTGRHRSLRPLPVPGWLVSVRFATGGAIVGRGVDSAVRVWDARSGAITDTFSAGAGLNLALADGRTVVAGAKDGTITVWDVAGARRLGSTFRWRSPDAGCLTTPCIVIDRRGTLMAESSGNGTVGLVDLRTERPAGTLPPRTGPLVDALAFLPDGRTLVTGGANGKAVLWDVRKRAAVRTLRLGGHVWWAAASPEGKLLALQTQAAGHSSSRVEVRDVASGQLLYRRNVSNGKGGLEFSPDGRKLAALGCCEPGSTIEVWSARSGKDLFSPRVSGHATSIAFSPDGRLFAAGTEDGKVVLWDSADGSPVGAPVDVATGPVEAISFSPDGRLFVASSADGRATLWNPRTHKRLADAFPEEEGSVPVARFTARGDLVIENVRNTSRWPIDPVSWARFACRVAGRDLTRAEWSDLLPSRPYQHICLH